MSFHRLNPKATHKIQANQAGNFYLLCSAAAAARFVCLSQFCCGCGNNYICNSIVYSVPDGGVCEKEHSIYTHPLCHFRKRLKNSTFELKKTEIARG